MPVRFADPPADGLAALRAVRADAAMKPLPAYTLGLDALAAGRGLAAAALFGWCYPLVAGGRVTGAAEVRQQTGGPIRLVAVADAEGIEEALGVAGDLPEVQSITYELRLLRIPAVSVNAVWLKDTQGADDRLVLLPPAFAPLRAQVASRAADLLPTLRRRAARNAELERRAPA